MFRGTHHHAIDAKGRTALPAEWREVLGRLGTAELVVTRGMDKALWAFPPAQFEVLEQKLLAGSQLDPKVRRAVDFLVGNAASVGLDKMGRVLVPQVLREWAGVELNSPVVWTGSIDRVRLWTQTRWQEVHGPTQDDLDEETTEFLSSLGV